MAPPDLAGNAPVLQPIDPVEPILFKLNRMDVELFLSHTVQHPLLDHLTVDIPLCLQHRFNDILASGTQPQPHRIGCFSPVEPHNLQVLFHLQSHFKAFHALVLATVAVDQSLFIQYTDLGQVVSQPTLIIIGVMARSDFDSPCAILHVHQSVIYHHYDFPFRNERVH